VPLNNPRYTALESTLNPRYGINIIPEINETAPKTTEKYEAGLSCILYDNKAARAPKIKATGVTIPCIGLESSGNTPTPIVASPVIRNNTKKILDELN
jgi:hypothetical protein